MGSHKPQFTSDYLGNKILLHPSLMDNSPVVQHSVISFQPSALLAPGDAQYYVLPAPHFYPRTAPSQQGVMSNTSSQLSIRESQPSSLSNSVKNESILHTNSTSIGSLSLKNEESLPRRAHEKPSSSKRPNVVDLSVSAPYHDTNVSQSLLDSDSPSSKKTFKWPIKSSSPKSYSPFEEL